MKLVGRIVIACGVLVGTTIFGQEPQGDKDKIQGTWKVVKVHSYNTDFKDIPGNEVVITASKCEGLGFAVLGYKIDSSKKPKTIDLEAKDGDKAIKLLGIYALDGDDLKVFWRVNPKFARPDDFPDGPKKDKIGVPSRLLILKRDKSK